MNPHIPHKSGEEFVDGMLEAVADALNLKADSAADASAKRVLQAVLARASDGSDIAGSIRPAQSRRLLAGGADHEDSWIELAAVSGAPDGARCLVRFLEHRGAVPLAVRISLLGWAATGHSVWLRGLSSGWQLVATLLPQGGNFGVDVPSELTDTVKSRAFEIEVYSGSASSSTVYRFEEP